MSNTPRDGGPAFPRQHVTADANMPGFHRGSDGMSLRDYFAAAALPQTMTDEWATAAQRAYEIADAMLRAREK